MINSALSDDAINGQARELYGTAPWPARWIQRYRPRICPFTKLVAYFPMNAHILDIGCGSGLLLGLLAVNSRVGNAIGFDSNAKSIELAKQMTKTLPDDVRRKIQFCRLDAREEWPEGIFDAVALVDVMHHVPPASHRDVFQKAVAKVGPKGRLIYKDMARRPAWSAWANRMHDMVMAGEWINYRSIDDIRQWGLESGLTIVNEERTRLLWYTHECIIFERSA